MKNILKPFIWLSVFILIVGLACNAVGGSQPTQPLPTEVPTTVPATSTQEPTQPEPTKAVPTPLPSPTNVPTAEPVGDSSSSGTTLPFLLAEDKYFHPDDLFEITPPDGWIMEEDDSSVSFSAPDDSGFVYLQVTNVGLELDQTGFERFVDARDENFFGGFENYELVDRFVNEEDTFITIEKTLTYNGVSQTVYTLYDQKDNAIYAVDLWADADKFDDYFEQYSAILDSIIVDSSLATNLDVYLWVYTFRGPSDLFTFEVPTSWKYERTTGDSVVVDTFYSPDDHAVIQNIAYDDGTQVSKSLAGAFALELLRSYYASDISITDDQVQQDGSERLTWNSPSQDFGGISFFESRGTTFLLFSLFWDNPFEDVYLDVLDNAINTYTAEEGNSDGGGMSGGNGSTAGIIYSTEFRDAADNDLWSGFTIGEDNYDYEFRRGEVLYVEVNAEDTTVYIVYDGMDFPDNVRIDAGVETVAGPNRNNISLVCRGTSDGWYEFSMNSGGFWFIWRYDDDGYTKLKEGGSTAINLQKASNEISAICDGDKLSFEINGKTVGSVRDNRIKGGGQVGVSVSAFDISGVGVEFDWLAVSTP